MTFSDRIERTVVLPVPRQRVWDAITKPEHLAHWLGMVSKMDFRVGGAIHFTWENERSPTLALLRYLLFEQLCEEGSGAAAGFATRLPITRQAITKHLVTLEQAGLVTVHETGRKRRYVPQPESFLNLSASIGMLYQDRSTCKRAEPVVYLNSS